MHTALYFYIVMPLFFDPSSGQLMKFFIRMVVQTAVAVVSMELARRFSSHLSSKHGVESSNAHAMYSFQAAILTLSSRMMQGSATSLGQSLLYELSGTCAELMTADTLLRGRTVFGDTLELAKEAKSHASKIAHIGSREQQKVSPAPEPGSMDAALPIVSNDDEAVQSREFCSIALLITCLAESASIIISSTYWGIMNANPGAPGAAAIPLTQTLLNLAIMLIGEVFVTDVIVAYAARNFSRYKGGIDPAKDWEDIKKKKKLVLVGIVVIFSCSFSIAISVFPFNQCFTSWGGTGGEEAEDYALTGCPAAPTNITEMSSVGESYQTLWGKYQGVG